MDTGPGQAVGLNFNPTNGNMSIAWGPMHMVTQAWMNLIGPPNHRVLVSTNMNVANTSNIQPGPKNPNYTEQVQWLDAATGKILAASDFFSPMSQGSQVWPGYGGLSYHMLFDGHIMALQVLPASSNSTSATPRSASPSSPTQNSTSTPTSGAG